MLDNPVNNTNYSIVDCVNKTERLLYLFKQKLYIKENNSINVNSLQMYVSSIVVPYISFEVMLLYLSFSHIKYLGYNPN